MDQNTNSVPKIKRSTMLLFFRNILPRKLWTDLKFIFLKIVAESET